LPELVTNIDFGGLAGFGVRDVGEGSLIPGGWDYNYRVTASINSDGFQGMGRESAVDAAASIAALFTLRNLNTGTQTFSSQLASIFTTNWWGSRLHNNTVVVQKGAARQVFTKLPDGSFNAPPTSADKLTQSGSELYLYGKWWRHHWVQSDVGRGRHWANHGWVQVVQRQYLAIPGWGLGVLHVYAAVSQRRPGTLLFIQRQKQSWLAARFSFYNAYASDPHVQHHLGNRRFVR
jgi:hypothetical protein